MIYIFLVYTANNVCAKWLKRLVLYYLVCGDSMRKSSQHDANSGIEFDCNLGAQHAQCVDILACITDTPVSLTD